MAVPRAAHTLARAARRRLPLSTSTTRALGGAAVTPGLTTMDSMVLPAIERADADGAPALRVPILPGSENALRGGAVVSPAATIEVEPEVMAPAISSMSADAVVLPMSELSDGHAMHVDFHAMADRVAADLRDLRRMRVPVDEQASMLKRVWNDMVDDMLKIGRAGDKTGPPSSS